MLDPALNDRLFDLEVRDPEAHEAADRLIALEQHHAVASPAQLLGGRHARGAGADDRDRLAGLRLRRLGKHPALLPSTVDDRVLDLFDRDRVSLTDLEYARRLTRRRTQPAGELGEVVRGVQLLDRVLEAVAVDEVVPVGDQVAQRTTVVAERHTAVHAASALLAQLSKWPCEEELAVVVRALDGVPLRDAVTLDLKKGPELAHQTGTATCWPAGTPACSARTRL